MCRAFSASMLDVTKRIAIWRRVRIRFRNTSERVNSMAGRPHKGDRVLLQFRPHRTVWELVHEKARQSGVSSVSQDVADVLAEHVGRPDLVVELGREEEGLPLAM